MVGAGVGVGVGAAPGVSVRVAERLVLPAAAEIVTTVFAVTAVVVTEKFADVWPAGTVTTACGVAARLSVNNVASIPPDGAGLFRKMVPIAVVPPTTLLGLNATDCRIGGAFGSGFTVTKIDLVTSPVVAVMRPPVG